MVIVYFKVITTHYKLATFHFTVVTIHFTVGIVHFKVVIFHFKMVSDQALIILPPSLDHFEFQYDRSAQLMTITLFEDIFHLKASRKMFSHQLQFFV